MNCKTETRRALVRRALSGLPDDIDRATGLGRGDGRGRLRVEPARGQDGGAALAAELAGGVAAHSLEGGVDVGDRPAADRDAIDLTLVKVAQLVADIPEIVELDINPLVADEEGASALRERRGDDGGAHPLQALIARGALEDAQVRELHGRDEPVLVVAEGRVELVRPGRLVVPPRHPEELGHLLHGEVNADLLESIPVRIGHRVRPHSSPEGGVTI